MSVTSFYLYLSAVLFALGGLGVLIRRNTIVIFMCIELMLNAANISIVALSSYFSSTDGQVYVFFIMAIAAAEASVGLAIILSVFRNYYSVKASEVYTLQG